MTLDDTMLEVNRFQKSLSTKTKIALFLSIFEYIYFKVLDDLRIPSLYLIVSYIQVLCDFAEVRYV